MKFALFRPPSIFSGGDGITGLAASTGRAGWQNRYPAARASTAADARQPKATDGPLTPSLPRPAGVNARPASDLAPLSTFMEERIVRIDLAAIIALGLSCAAWSTNYAGERHGTPLPGPLGRFCGIGYSSGYHAHYPNRPTWQQRLHPFSATPYPPGLAVGPASCPQCAGPSQPTTAYEVPLDAAQLLQEQPQSAPAEPTYTAPAEAARSQPIQQPPREPASSDRSSFFKRLPNLRGAASVPDRPTEPGPPKKGSVARSSIGEAEAR